MMSGGSVPDNPLTSLLFSACLVCMTCPVRSLATLVFQWFEAGTLAGLGMLPVTLFVAQKP